MTTIITDKHPQPQTHTQADIQTDMPMATGKTLQICVQILSFYLQKVGQDHGVQFSQRHHSTAKSANLSLTNFAPALTFS